MIEAGKLDERVELFAPSAGIDDGYTTAPDGYVQQGTRWAQYMPGTVREVFENFAREGEQPALFLVRRDSLTETINETWKVLHRGVTFDVKGAVRSGRDGIRITCVGSSQTVGGVA